MSVTDKKPYVSTTELRNVLDFATRLRLLGRDEAPDGWVEHKIHKLATEIQMHYGTSLRHKRLRIIAYLKNDDESCGSASRNELQRIFGWPMPSIKQVLEDLERDGVIESFPARVKEGRGPKGKRYRLTEGRLRRVA